MHTVRHYHTMFEQDGINTVYSGPLWQEGIERLAEMLQAKLRHDELTPAVSQSIFSIFVEQMHNMLMHSAKADPAFSDAPGGRAANGTFILGARGRGYFIRTGNVIAREKVAGIRDQIDYLNSLDAAALRKHYRERMRGDNPNPGSKGAGLGMIEIARRASSKLEYEFSDYGEGFSLFEMHVTIGEAD